MTIAELNQRHAIVNVGNKTVVMELLPNGSIHELWAFDDFKKKLIKEKIRVRATIQTAAGPVPGAKWVPIADYWLKHPQGRIYDRLVYSMPGSTILARPNDYNGWQGFTVEPMQGCWELNKAHIREVICGGNDEYFCWVMNWLAALVQFPGRHAWVCLVLRGGQGTGKGYFFDYMIGRLFGPQQYLHILGAGQLTAEFNEHLSGKVFIFADESTWGGDPRAASKLKGLITEDTIPIHRKFLKMVEEPSMLHTGISSNSDWPIPIEHDDRRFSVMDVSAIRKQDDPYFAALRKEMAEGGRSAMLHELLAWPVVDRMLRTPLSSAAKSDITTQSLKNIEHWWLEILESGIVQHDAWPDSILKRDLHQLYIDFLEKHHKSSRERRSTETEMGMFLRKFTPITQQMTVNGKIERVLWLPSIEACRAEWVKAFHWSPAYEWDVDLSVPKDAGDAWEAPGPGAKGPGGDGTPF